MHVLRQYIVASEKVLFEGDGYSEAWQKEAEKRGLPNVKTTPLALDAMVTDKAKKLFENNDVYTHGELEARHEIEIMKNNSSKRKSDTKSGSQQRNKQMSQRGKGSKSRSMSNGSGNRSNGK